MSRPIRALLRGSGPARYVAVSEGYPGPGSIIHNYFPDGEIHSADLIDTENDQDYDEHIWQGQAATEILDFEPSAGSKPGEVSVTIDGWSQGVFARDWSGVYGAKEIPVGRYRISFSIRASGGLEGIIIRSSPTSSGDMAYEPTQRAILDSGQRYILDAYLDEIGSLGLSLVIMEEDQPEGTGTPSGTFFVSKVMVTEGDPAKFQDGSSEDWEWLGTPHASISRGPQP